MERAHLALSNGERTLDEVVEELGGDIQELGWRDLESLTELPEKARILLLQSGPSGFTVPYQQAGALYLIEVAERSEPVRLAYEDVAQQVREDYVNRFAQRLTREAMESRLTEGDFRFFEDKTRLLLGAQ